MRILLDCPLFPWDAIAVFCTMNFSLGTWNRCNKVSAPVQPSSSPNLRARRKASDFIVGSREQQVMTGETRKFRGRKQFLNVFNLSGLLPSLSAAITVLVSHASRSSIWKLNVFTLYIRDDAYPIGSAKQTTKTRH